jgi:glutamate/tyrosine decarboxylase-like PLP-dependent enzyme
MTRTLPSARPRPYGTPAAALDDLLDDAAARATRYLQELPGRAVAPTADAVAALTALEHSLPVSSSPPEDVLERLDRLGSPATMAMAGPRFFGFVIGGTLPVALAANWLATAWDQNAALHTVTPGVAAIEQVALRWLLELLGLPATAQGAFVTGATVGISVRSRPHATRCSRASDGTLRRTAWSVRRR